MAVFLPAPVEAAGRQVGEPAGFVLHDPGPGYGEMTADKLAVFKIAAAAVARELSPHGKVPGHVGPGRRGHDVLRAAVDNKGSKTVGIGSSQSFGPDLPIDEPEGVGADFAVFGQAIGFLDGGYGANIIRHPGPRGRRADQVLNQAVADRIIAAAVKGDGASDLIGTLVAYSGVVVIATRGDPLSLRFTDSLGVGLALGSTVIWALFWIYNAKDDKDPMVGLLLNFVFGFPLILIACFLFSEPIVRSLPGLLGAAYLGLFEMGLTFALWLTALRLSEKTSRVANLIFISPFISLVLIHIFVGEEILASTFMGLALIVAGLVVQSLRRRS